MMKTYAEAVVKELQKSYYPEDSYEIDVTEVVKNNDQHMVGITIKPLGTCVAPNIYINKAYEDNLTVQEAAAQICSAYEKNKIPEFQLNTDELTDWEYAKERLYFRFVSANTNEEFLADKPKFDFLDLKGIFYVQISDGASMPVNYRIMETYGKTPEELKAVAVANTKANKPAIGKSMYQTMVEMLGEEQAALLGKDDGRTIVWSNEQKMNGATALLTADFGSKPRYILPSSIHEVLSISADEAEVSTLQNMVQEVNDTQVAPDEILSYSVYYWDGEALSIAE